MATITIKGNSYRLGDLPGSVENFEVAGMLMDMGEKTEFSRMLPGARRMLIQSIEAAEGPEKAAVADADLKLSVNKDGEFMTACRALIKTILE